MTWNLLMWKWSEEFTNSPKKKRPKFSTIVGQFLATSDHPVFSDMNLEGFTEALEKEFGEDQTCWPFVLEVYPRCVVANYPNEIRFEIVPTIAAIGKRFDLNSSEF